MRFFPTSGPAGRAAARIDFDDAVSAARVEDSVGEPERAIKARFPEIRQLFLAAKGD